MTFNTETDTTIEVSKKVILHAARQATRTMLRRRAKLLREEAEHALRDGWKFWQDSADPDERTIREKMRQLWEESRSLGNGDNGVRPFMPFRDEARLVLLQARELKRLCRVSANDTLRLGRRDALFVESWS